MMPTALDERRVVRGRTEKFVGEWVDECWLRAERRIEVQQDL